MPKTPKQSSKNAKPVGMSSNYDSKYWSSKIQGYLQEDWSRLPSPFVRLASAHFKPGSRVLELGSGAGQDGIWLEEQGFDVVFSDGNTSAFDNIQSKSKKHTRPVDFDITARFPFNDNSFDVVYAQLVLHYFDDETMLRIMNEIKRVLSKNGILALMVNSVEDPEYKDSSNNESGILIKDKLLKRYFSVNTLKPFVDGFSPIVFNDKGRTPKDDAVNNSGMIQFVGKLYE